MLDIHLVTVTGYGQEMLDADLPLQRDARQSDVHGYFPVFVHNLLLRHDVGHNSSLRLVHDSLQGPLIVLIRNIQNRICYDIEWEKMRQTVARALLVIPIVVRKIQTNKLQSKKCSLFQIFRCGVSATTRSLCKLLKHFTETH